MNRNDRMIKIDKYQVSNNNEQYHSLHNYQARPVPVRSVKDFFFKEDNANPTDKDNSQDRIRIRIETTCCIVPCNPFWRVST